MATDDRRLVDFNHTHTKKKRFTFNLSFLFSGFRFLHFVTILFLTLAPPPLLSFDSVVHYTSPPHILVATTQSSDGSNLDLSEQLSLPQ